MRRVTQQRFGGPEVLELVEVDRPEPGPTEVLVRVHAAGVNPVDWASRSEEIFLGQPPFTLGWDVSGVVEEIGDGATGVAVGDHVLGMPWFPREAAGYADYVTAPSRQFVPNPANMSHVQAAGSRGPRALLSAGVRGSRSEQTSRTGRNMSAARSVMPSR